MPSITLRAFAKINLSLRVRERRSDGFHEVQSILQAISLFDTLTIETRRGPFEIRCGAPGVPTDRSNLVWKSAQRLWEAAGRAGEPHDVRVTLDKQIPSQAGLGGGSSDAAAALLGFRRLWKLRLLDGQIRAIAAELGSDVPYFLVGGTALALGRGEQVYPLQELPRHWAVLAVPPFGVSTRDAYDWLVADRRQKEGLQQARDARSNDLESAVIDRHPLIGTIKQRLTERGAEMAAMSGSGSTVFGVFKTQRGAKAAARVLERRRDLEGTRVLVRRFLQRRDTPNLPVSPCIV
jgi:4-diphosphocytidyl-2-C-methyl-D-erythritol kinase